MRTAVKLWTRASRVSVSVQPDTAEMTAKQVIGYRGYIGPLICRYKTTANSNEPCSDFLDINECESAPCLNGGVCTDRVNYFECTCAAGSTGDHCETGSLLASLLFASLLVGE